jgi:gamma-glutamyltranspeptidase
MIDQARFAAQGKSFAVATPHRAATEAAVAAFHAGGNSVDAALAASAVLAVVYPHMCGIGGDLFALVSDRGSTVALNGSGAAASALHADWVRREYGSMPVHGPLSVSVPGTVAAWNELATRFGRLSLAAAIAPAITLAQDGAPLAGSVARSIVKHQERLRQDAGISDLMLPGGRPLEIGQPLLQPALAATLRAIASAGSSAFYDGPVGSRLVAALASMGSRLTEADFRGHSTEVTPPLAMAYRDLEVLVPPPNSQGFVLLEILGCVERGRLTPDHLGPDAATLAHIFRLASGDRDNFLADPRYAPVPIDDLLSADHAKELLDRAGQPPNATTVSRRATGDTVGIVAIQEGGPWVAINHSLYDAFGSGILEPSTGIICHNRGSYFSLDRSAPNFLVGSKRPAHTLMPVMVMREGRPIVASATMGGSAHAQIHAELLLAVLDRGERPADAISRPRWLVGGMQRYGGPGIVAERRVPIEVVEKMVGAAFEVQMLDDWDEQVGHAQMAARAPNGSLSAASDPRADGSAGAG